MTRAVYYGILEPSNKYLDVACFRESAPFHHRISITPASLKSNKQVIFVFMCD